MTDFQLPLWVDYLQALGPTLVAGTVAMIAYRQWATARDRLKLDLFDRRYAIYEQLRTLLANALVEGTIGYEDVITCRRNTRGLEFLFGYEVEDYVEGLTKSLNMWAYHEGQVKLGPDAHNYEKHVDESARLTNYAADELSRNMRPIFQSYLSFSHLK